MRYGYPGDLVPSKYQMLITFDDESFVCFTTSMYGGIYVFCHTLDNKYRTLSLNSISPLSEQFDEVYFEKSLQRKRRIYPLKRF